MNVFEYIKTEENRYKLPFGVPVVEGWQWGMFRHVKLTTLYLNSQYETGKEDDKPFRNIILPKINLEHRAVQFDLKEIEFYINSEDEDYKAFLVRKWHQRWALQNNISDFLDKMSETYTDYGGVLIKNTSDAIEVVPFQRLAFCDQTDMMSGPICEKHQYSPDQLKEMESKGWQNIDEVIQLAQEEKSNSQTENSGPVTQIKAKTPGRYIEVFELHGTLPETFLDPEGDPNTFARQMQVITFYQSKETGKKEGITLYSGKENKSIYKAFKRDEIYGRALGRGAVEELFEPQVWVNYNEIAKKEMLDEVSKVLWKTTDQSFKARNKTSDMENGDTVVHATGTEFDRLNTQAVNTEAFDNAVAQWNETAMQIASAQPTIAGDETKSGMPFRLGALLNQESHSLHQYRKSKLGNFLSSEVYPDWVIPKMLKAVSAGEEFLSSLSLEEMNEVVDQIVACQFNETIIAKVLKGEMVFPEDAEQLLDTYKKQFFKSNRKFITILEGELKGLPLEVEVNITGEQRDKILMAEKVSQIWSQASQILMVAPNFFSDHPEMADLFNQVIESSGLSALNFGMKGHIKPVPTPQLTPQPNAPKKVPAQVQAQPQAA